MKKSRGNGKEAGRKKGRSNKDCVDGKMLIGEIVRRHPETVQIMLQHGMHCVGCHISAWETLEQGASGHGIDVNTLIIDLNSSIRGGGGRDDAGRTMCQQELC